MDRLAKFWRDRRGTSALEVAMVFPVFVALTVGVINICLAMFAQANMNAAAESTARYLSVTSGTTCDNTTANTKGRSLYKGPNLKTLAFTCASANCGKQVAGTATFRITTGLYNPNVTISSKSCYP